MPDTAHLGAHALAEMHDKARRAGVDPFAPTRAIELGPPPTPGPTIRELIEPIDWEQELAERAAAERAAAARAQTKLVQAELARIAEAEEIKPAQPRRWYATQMRSAQP